MNQSLKNTWIPFIKVTKGQERSHKKSAVKERSNGHINLSKRAETTNKIIPNIKTSSYIDCHQVIWELHSLVRKRRKQNNWKMIPQDQSGSLKTFSERPRCCITHLVKINTYIGRFQPWWKNQEIQKGVETDSPPTLRRAALDNSRLNMQIVRETRRPVTEYSQVHGSGWTLDRFVK